MQGSVAVTLMSYGEGRRRLEVPAATATVDDAVRLGGFDIEGRRVAVNGRQASGGSPLVEGDVVTLVPRVMGG